MIVLKKSGVTIVQSFKTTNEMNRKNDAKKNNTSFWIPVKRNKIHVAPKLKKSKKTAITFQRALRGTLVVGQAFSLIPVVGILSNNTADVRFVRTSWKCVYAVISFIGQVYMTIMCIYKLIIMSSLKSTTPIIFYGTGLISMAMFFQVGRNWPSLLKHIAKSEEMDPNFDNRLTFRCNITCAIVLILALFEHILSLLSAFAGAMVCYPRINLYEGFVRHFYPWVFDFMPYSPALGLVTQFLHFQSTFIWNFTDLFIICMSYYLTSRLEQLNKRLLEAQGKYLPETFWRTSREDYCRVTQLVRKVDEVISGIIFISFANNLFFICLQLFNTLGDGIKGTGDCSSRARGTTQETKIFGGYEAAAYFVFSLIFLISRSVAVSLIASQVNSASSVPAPVLYDVPSPVFCVEVQRFLDQVNSDKVALTGLQFFSVTRGLLLTVAGTIVTYELVMVQFNSPALPAPAFNNTNLLPLVSTTSTP